MDIDIFLVGVLGLFAGFVFLRFLHAMEESS
jgi:hypothetical protein